MQIVKNKIEWNKILKTNFQELMDVYFRYEYFNLYSKTYEVLPEALFWENKKIKIFWSHLIRKINNIDLYKDYTYNDLTTPYGYGGPLILPKVDDNDELEDSLEDFFHEYREYAEEKRYVCEFIRFYPILKNWVGFEKLFNIIYLNDVVVLDLTQDYEEIWNNMAKNTRYYTRKAINEFEKIVIADDPTVEEINEFVSLYYETMDKNDASKKYYFPHEFIKNHYNFGNLLIYCKNKNNVVGSSAMFLKGNQILHYHLSATNYNFKNPPSRAVIWGAIEWAKEHGLNLLYFGGGRTKNDSLFNFKKGFSKTYLPFYIGKIMFDSKIYKELTSLNSLTKENKDFFPLYRVGYDETIV